MCGIIAFTGSQAAAPILLDGLRRLEYRGYDSAGMTVFNRKKLHTWKSSGKLEALTNLLPEDIKGNTGIGHTRWATHGVPSNENAHPHLDNNQRIALVHNGIIENVDAIKASLPDDTEIQSETDTEILAHAIANEGGTLSDAVRAVLRRVIGTFGIAVIDRDNPSTLVVARSGSPVILGIGDGEMFAASDVSALSRHTRELVHLDDGEVAELTPDGFTVTALDASPKEKSRTQLQGQPEEHDKGGYPHYLLKEIYEQPETVRRAVSGRLEENFSTAHLGGLNLQARDLLALKRVVILGCGSALYAGMAGAHMIESLARIPTTAESAAEFRYRNPVIEANTLYIAVSQSGETFDTLAAIREIKRKGGFVLGVVNSVGSTIAREVDGGIYMHAGPEISVASTKAYTSMLTLFGLLALLLGRTRDLSVQQGNQLVNSFKQLPDQIEQVLGLDKQIAGIAGRIAKAQSAFFIGRTDGYPVALEGAQKLKEVSYIHAEAYPASELKHGPLALVSKDTPCVVILQQSDLLAKNISSLEEINARGAPIIAVTDSDEPRIAKIAKDVIQIPTGEALLQPIVMGIALQLLAYHCAVRLKRDVDQPRNLAKSVTVE